MDNLALEDRVIYNGEDAERAGQEAEIIEFGVDDLLEIRFATPSTSGSFTLVTFSSYVMRSERGTIYPVGTYPVVDDGRVTSVDH